MRWPTASRNVLGIEAVDAPQPTFAQIRTQITDRTIGTAFRDGWQGDYPSMMEFLEPLFVTGAGSNDVDDSHPAFDAALTAAEAAPALPESCALNQRRAASLVARHACRTAVGLHQRRCPTTSASSRADVTSFVSYFDLKNSGAWRVPEMGYPDERMASTPWARRD